MKLAVYGKKFSAEAREDIENLHSILVESKIDFKVFHRLNDFIKSHCNLGLDFDEFHSHEDLISYQPDFLITIGGDGTILDATTLVRDSGIPILGINTGRLGFLSNVNRKMVAESLESIFREDYKISQRRLLHLECDALDLDLPFALNEITVSRKDTTAMVTVEVSIDGEFFNNYWADGLIIATPTGSTGYSLSCNGPIIMPGSETLVLTPIAPHNLTARPFVIPNSCEIELKVYSREGWNLVSLDSRIYSLPNGEPLKIRIADFTIGLVETADQTFAQTLRNKLMWGMDKRN